eukprot:TRINITY_DN7149_c2_g1_i1.p1 TRINITY_DN7149_c2_g1~~TRINITY_DN7149_c2_g1_i1.p1  ORF type:complete len:651 (+),score=166.41 TRINITY_DN7149_c2_g1_i1:110-2062(+)
MGNTSLQPVKGVPMPPRAWALATMWSEVWDAPRFRGHSRVQKKALHREALAPLLKIAASCVAAIHPHVEGFSRKAAVPPHGASRELLVAAIDGDPWGAALSDPAGNPVGFVRALARSAFQTGDGDFLEGITEASIDELLTQHCKGQLDQAARLKNDPTAALQSTLEAARQAVQQLTSMPPKAGDLAGVADRLLLIQRLERVSEDARAIAEATKEREEASKLEAMEDEEEMPEDTESSTSNAAYAEADAKALEEEVPMQRSETQQTPSAKSGSLGSASEATTEDQPPLKRTKSQIATTLKVQKVKQHHDQLCTEVHDLCRTTSVLASQEPAEEIESLKADLAAVEQARKRSTNFGEDLLEDMLFLDNLSGLTPEDRTTRKATIGSIEALLQDVDTAKARLANLHRSLEAKLKKLESEKAPEAAAEVTEEEAEAGANAKSAAEERAKQGRDAAKTALQPSPPGKEIWRQVRLPLKFHTREESGQYIVSATIPGLDQDDLKIELGDAASTLLVEGLRVPSEREATAMRKRISKKIKQLAQTSPEQFARVVESLPQVASDAYVELGQGEFGRFAETFRIPDSVDVDRINASYRDGVLRVALPKKVTVPEMPKYGSGHYFGGRGLPTRGQPGLGRAGAAPWGGSLFGGHDDFFRW